MTKSKALVKNQALVRRAAMVTAGGMAKALGANELGALLASRGVGWVMQQVQAGAIQLTKAAFNYLTATQQQVSNLSVQSAPTSTGVTLVGNRSLNGNINIRHRELIKTVEVPFANPQVISWVLNPGCSTFPYLSTIARNYDKYRFRSIRFFIVSSAPTVDSGRYYLSWEPDSDDPVPTPIGSDVPAGALMNAQHSLSTAVWQSAGLTLPGMTQTKFTGPFPDALKDHGRFILAAKCSSSISLEVYAEYDVELSQPQVGDCVEALDSSIFISNSLGRAIGVQLCRAYGVKQLQFPPGRYRIDYTIKGTGIARVTNSTTGTTAQKYIGSSIGTSEANEISLIRGDGMMVFSINDTWATLTHAAMMITPLSRDAFEFLYQSLP